MWGTGSLVQFRVEIQPEPAIVYRKKPLQRANEQFPTRASGQELRTGWSIVDLGKLIVFNAIEEWGDQNAWQVFLDDLCLMQNRLDRAGDGVTWSPGIEVRPGDFRGYTATFHEPGNELLALLSKPSSFRIACGRSTRWSTRHDRNRKRKLELVA